MKLKNIFRISYFLFALLLSGTASQAQKKSYISIPVPGNTWPSSPELRTRSGEIRRWQDPTVTYTTYFRTNKTGHLHLDIYATTSNNDKAQLNILVNGKAKSIEINATNNGHITVGDFDIRDTGYQRVTFEGVSKTGGYFPSVDSIFISGEATTGQLAFTPNDKDNFYHWGRRGPSVHLNYILPKGKNIEWFYNEVTVPVGEDPVGSYFMANGFGEGYFGFQVNSQNSRRVLFSVWSPFSTNNPNEIPEEDKIQLLKKGSQTTGKSFGGEGSGGQSFIEYPWKAGTTYKFLLHVHPNGNNTTDYSAYFYDVDHGEWLLIAGFRRPKTDTWLRGAHSFLENFNPAMGNVDRIGTYNNQWARTEDGQWIEIRKAYFTGDNTANLGYRMDYQGGIRGNAFFLRNGGFFNDYIPTKQFFERPETHNKAPEIDFSKLP